MIIGYHHAQISVPSGCADRVREFYGQSLGLPELPVPANLQGIGLIWFKVGDRELHVGVENNIDRLATKTHLAYAVDDLVDFRRLFLSLGIEMIDQPNIENYDRFHIRDPFGNRIEFIQRLR